MLRRSASRNLILRRSRIRMLSDGANPFLSEGNGSTIVQGPSLLTSTGVHRPNPSMFHLPGLRSLPFWTKGDQIAFNDPDVRKVVHHVESFADLIRSEYQSAVVGVNSKSEDGILQPDYDLGGKFGEHSDGALHQGQWDWHSYILKGVKQPRFSKLCPETTRCLEEIEPYLFSSTPFSFAFFSTLQPGASISPHSAPMNLRLRVHLPILVSSNGDCGIKCGGQERKWIPDKALVLDDSYTHNVWNLSDEPRVVLLFDIWHPDVQLGERQRIDQMFGYAREQGWLHK